MKKAICLVAVCGVLAVPFAAQTKPYAYTFEKGKGTCVLTGVTFDEVWSAVNRTLPKDSYNIISADKQTGTIVAAHWDAVSSFHFSLSLFIESVSQDIRVTSNIIDIQYDNGLTQLMLKKRQNSMNQKYEKTFYDKLAKVLYPPVSKDGKIK